MKILESHTNSSRSMCKYYSRVYVNSTTFVGTFTTTFPATALGAGLGAVFGAGLGEGLVAGLGEGLVAGLGEGLVAGLGEGLVAPLDAAGPNKAHRCVSTVGGLPVLPSPPNLL